MKQKLLYQRCLSTLVWLIFCFSLVSILASPKKSKESLIKLSKYANKNIPPKSKIININLAQKDELTEIPGVGEKIATLIIRYRKKHQKFSSIQELKKIKGVGEKKLKQMKGRIKI